MMSGLFRVMATRLSPAWFWIVTGSLASIGELAAAEQGEVGTGVASLGKLEYLSSPTLGSDSTAGGAPMSAMSQSVQRPLTLSENDAVEESLMLIWRSLLKHEFKIIKQTLEACSANLRSLILTTPSALQPKDEHFWTLAQVLLTKPIYEKYEADNIDLLKYIIANGGDIIDIVPPGEIKPLSHMAMSLYSNYDEIGVAIVSRPTTQVNAAFTEFDDPLARFGPPKALPIADLDVQPPKLVGKSEGSSDLRHFALIRGLRETSMVLANQYPDGYGNILNQQLNMSMYWYNRETGEFDPNGWAQGDYVGATLLKLDGKTIQKERFNGTPVILELVARGFIHIDKTLGSADFRAALSRYVRERLPGTSERRRAVALCDALGLKITECELAAPGAFAFLGLPAAEPDSLTIIFITLIVGALLAGALAFWLNIFSCSRGRDGVRAAQSAATPQDKGIAALRRSLAQCGLGKVVVSINSAGRVNFDRSDLTEAEQAQFNRWSQLPLVAQACSVSVQPTESLVVAHAGGGGGPIPAASDEDAALH